jgi:hypothetical protein
MRVSLLRTGKGESGLYPCCSAARIDRRSSGKSRVMAFSVAFGVATNKIAPDALRRNGPFTYSITYPRQPRTYPKLSCCPPIECEKASQREYSRSTDEEIVISRAYAGAVFQSTCLSG